MKCPFCQAENLSDAQICASCGGTINQNTCPKGHPVDPSWDRCPYCQSPLQQESSGTAGQFVEGSGTMVGGYDPQAGFPQNSDQFRKGHTVIEDSNVQQSFSDGGKRKTVIETPEGIPKGSTELERPYTPSRKKKTVIIPLDTEGDNVDKRGVSAPMAMLVGWLVSFTLDKYGRDFRLREGRNCIGSNPEMDLVITEDTTISDHHATIMYRNKKLFLQDEMSSNGTFLNGEDILGPPREIHDGDNITMGKTEFLIKTI